MLLSKILAARQCLIFESADQQNAAKTEMNSRADPKGPWPFLLVFPSNLLSLGQFNQPKMHAEAYRTFADLVLVTHVSFVAFVVLGFFTIVWGGFAGWRWIRNPWFRAAHLAGIGLVVLQAWLGVICPLTTLELYLREKAGGTLYDDTFIAHWLQRLLYFEAQPWVFVACYTAFGLAVIGSWIKFPPRPIRPAPKT